MANVFDYLKWRHDIELSVDPFNVVDDLLFSLMIYTNFSEIMIESDRLTLSEASKRYFNRHAEEEILGQNGLTKFAPLLLKEMGASKRFGPTEIFGYIDENDADQVKQLSILSCQLPDDSIYIAFRGTDGSIVGWKEDLLFSYKDKTIGQEDALSYVKRYFQNSSQRLRLGGHSKGGNLAMYVGMHLDNLMQDRVVSIFSGDGPGFQIELVESEGYQRIKSKMTLILPQSTMIGQLMNHDVTPIFVMSDAKGILQHDGFSWQIEHNHFVSVEKQSEQSLFFKQVVELWLDNISKDQRQVFIDIFFSFYEESKEQTMDAALARPLQLLLATKHQLSNLSKEQQKQFFDILKQLLKLTGKGIGIETKRKLAKLKRNPKQIEYKK